MTLITDIPLAEGDITASKGVVQPKQQTAADVQFNPVDVPPGGLSAANPVDFPPVANVEVSGGPLIFPSADSGSFEFGDSITGLGQSPFGLGDGSAFGSLTPPAGELSFDPSFSISESFDFDSAFLGYPYSSNLDFDLSFGEPLDDMGFGSFDFSPVEEHACVSSGSLNLDAGIGALFEAVDPTESAIDAYAPEPGTNGAASFYSFGQHPPESIYSIDPAAVTASTAVGADPSAQIAKLRALGGGNARTLDEIDRLTALATAEKGDPVEELRAQYVANIPDPIRDQLERDSLGHAVLAKVGAVKETNFTVGFSAYFGGMVANLTLSGGGVVDLENSDARPEGGELSLLG